MARERPSYKENTSSERQELRALTPLSSRRDRASAIIPAVASAHAEISPTVSLSGKLQLYSLAVPTEKSGLTTSKIVMTVPYGFGIDSFVPPRPVGLSRSSRPGPATTQ